ncbi:uncharacterized protein FIBRA_00603 [Fibroporia radiculosa]|uniref:Uncharacterized protein n=1 Tax=Fibroporia radiculosa TaxID=599839 RepID=J4I811_9APHY|nr:uncharacterized protein FIBRA_00603 [Fibroporia radiculosa]CCL98601.1 predicted protein [Fibroporia radiculosa]
MVSVHAPSYIPPLAFESFSLSEPEKQVTQLNLSSAGCDLPYAYSPLPARIRGPRHRQRRGQSSQQLSDGYYVHYSSGTGDPQRSLQRKSTIPHKPKGVNPLPSRARGASLRDAPNRFTSAVAIPPLLPFRSQPQAASICALVDERKVSEVAQEDRHAEMSHDAALQSLGNAMGTNRARVAPGQTPQNLSTEKPESVRALNTAAQMVSYKCTSAPASGSTSLPGPTMLQRAMMFAPGPGHVVYDDAWLGAVSAASSRPTSALPGETIDQLETLAEELRTMHPAVLEQFRPRAPAPRHGPRPCTPQSVPTTPNPRGLVSSTSRPSTSAGTSGTLDAAPEGDGMIGFGDDERAADIESRAPAKEKWKATWIPDSDDEDEALIDVVRRINSAPRSSSPVIELDGEQAYNAKDAPEFLVGASTSSTVYPTSGFRSGSRHIHPSTSRKARSRSRPRKPAALVLALGSQPDPDALGNYQDYLTAQSGHPSSTTPQRSVPSTPHHLATQMDLRGLELLIGPIELRPKPKPKSMTRLPSSINLHGHSTGNTSSRNIHSPNKAETSQGTTSPIRRNAAAPRSRRRLGSFWSLRRWFGRWIR